MNLGVDKIIKSNFVLMLNCGDFLYLNRDCSYILDKQDYYNSFYTNTLLIDQHGSEKIWNASHESLDKFMSINHQSVFINVANFRKLGGFSLKYKIASDYDFFRRYLQNRYELIKIDIPPICKFQSFGGFSDKFRFKLELETALIRFKFKKNPIIFLVHFFRLLKYKVKA
jgi:hypothetical protein